MGKIRSGKDVKSKDNAQTAEKAGKERPPSEALTVAQGGISTTVDFCALMSAFMTDASSGALTPQEIGAACRAGGLMLKAIELQNRYGARANKSSTARPLALG